MLIFAVVVKKNFHHNAKGLKQLSIILFLLPSLV